MGTFDALLRSTPFGTLWGIPTQVVVMLAVMGSIYIALIINFIMHLRSMGVTITGHKRKMTLLVGPKNAGKTLLFHQLRDGHAVETVTSMKELEDKFIVHPKYNSIKFGADLTVIDFPGHERLRSRVSDYYPVIGCMVFVVDAADTSSSFRDAAEYLYDIFSNAKFNDVAPKMLIACNKSDVANAASVDAVREALERELTKLKKTRASLETEGEEDNSTVPVGREDAPFDFGVDAPCEVNFTKCSFKTGDLEDVALFVLKN